MPGELISQHGEEPLSSPSPVVLLLLDGWGVAPESAGNAIKREKAKNFFRLLTEYPACTLKVEKKSESARYSALGGHGTLSSFLYVEKIKQSYLCESEKSSAVLSAFVSSRNTGKVISKTISSPLCDSYDLEPAMSLDELGRQAVKTIREAGREFILISVANLDAVSLSANLDTISKLVSKVDAFLGKIAEEVLLKKGTLLVSSAGGNIEKMIDVRTDLVDRESTLNPVPLIIVGEEFKGRSLFANDAPGGDLSLLEPVGRLADLPATILGAFGFAGQGKVPGQNLLEK